MDYEVRYYDSTGKRKDIPLDAITDLSFELGERGGFQNGSITLNAGWNDISATSTEYFDIRMFGATTVTYRGFAMLPTQEVGDPERWTFSMFGGMEKTNGYLVRKDYTYSAYTDIGTIFQDIAADWVSPHISGLVVDVTGVSALNLKLLGVKVSGKTASQAFNALLDAAPLSLIWGFDVDSSGANRIYLRPRSSSVQDVYTVGGNVTAMTYPRDATQVANKLYLTGGLAPVPNLIPNASFEISDAVTDDSANLLFNGSFETQTDSGGSRQNAWFWTNTGGMVRRQYPDDNPGSGNLSRTGNCYTECETNGGTFSQPLIQIGYPQPVVASLWARQNTNGDSESFYMWVQEQNAAGTVLATLNSATFTPATNSYQQFSCTFTPTQATTTQLTFGFTMNSAGGTAHGIIADDAVLTLSNPTASSWRVGESSNAVFTTLDWQSKDYAYDGIQSVKVQPNITSGGGYVEIRIDPQVMVNVQPGKTTYFTCWFRGVAGTAALGWREFADGTNTSTLVGVATGINTGGWTRLVFSYTSGTTTNKIDPFIRIFDTSNNPVYIDAAMITQGAAPALTDFWKGANYEAVIDVTALELATAGLGASQQASITTYGLREKSETVEEVTNRTLLDVFALAYFTAFALPVTQGRLTVKNATRAVDLSGTLRLVNLANKPAPMFPSRVRYRIAESVDIDIDLNNERPDMANLLRKAANQAVQALNASQGASGASGSGGTGGTPVPTSAGVTSFASDANTALTGAVVLASSSSVRLKQSSQTVAITVPRWKQRRNGGG